MPPRLHREQRRARLLNRLEMTAFWACVAGGLGLVWLVATALS
jgi:hypothetical protein